MEAKISMSAKDESAPIRAAIEKKSGNITRFSLKFYNSSGKQLKFGGEKEGEQEFKQASCTRKCSSI